MDNKTLFYIMQGEKMCVQHVFLNALDLYDSGGEVKIIFEGKSVLLPPELAGTNTLYERCLSEGLIAGVCKACSQQLGSLDAVMALGLPLLDDMSGHAGIKPFSTDGYAVISF